MISIVLSWFIVGFGQPAWIAWLSPLAACCGYALFWKEALKIRSAIRRFWVAAGWFTLVQLVQLSWMTAIEFQGVYILVVYTVLCFALGMQWGLLTLAVNKIPHVAVAALWTLLELSRLYFLCGFSWNPVGLSLTAFVPSMQMASIFGVFGLSFLVILTNLAALKKKRVIWLALVAFPYIFGLLHLGYHSSKLETSPHISVGLVQTGLLPPQKLQMEGFSNSFISPYEQWQRILTSLKQAHEKFDLIVLPEYAVPYSAEADVYAGAIVRDILEESFGKEALSLLPNPNLKISNRFWSQALANLSDAEVVVGLGSDEGGSHFSAAFHFLPRGGISSRYEKQVLVPLGEYIPFAWLKQFTERYGIFEFFTPGTEAKVFHGKVPLSVSICYEETFSHLIREGRVKGAELFVNVTNDNWYPFSKLPLQHFTHGRLRTVENGVPLVRACNTAVTAAVDSLGRTVGQIVDEQKSDVLTVLVPTYHYRTLYTLWGDWGIVLLCLIFLMICGWKTGIISSLFKIES